MGLIGPNGAGKSTLFGVLSGHITPKGGRVLLERRDITRLPPHVRCWLGIGRTFQIPRPFHGLTVLENVMVGARWGGRAHDPTRALEVLESLNLLSLADMDVAKLNTGQLKLLELARAMAGGPRYLLLDEVFAGLNPAEKAYVSEAVVRFAKSRGIGVLVVEHDLKTIFSLSQRVVVLHLGEVLAEGTPDRVASDESVIAAYTGGAT